MAFQSNQMVWRAAPEQRTGSVKRLCKIPKGKLQDWWLRNTLKLVHFQHEISVQRGNGTKTVCIRKAMQPSQNITKLQRKGSQRSLHKPRDKVAKSQSSGNLHIVEVLTYAEKSKFYSFCLSVPHRYGTGNGSWTPPFPESLDKLENGSIEAKPSSMQMTFPPN